MKIPVSLWLLAAMTWLGFMIRGYKITSSPPSLNVDEVSIGYNAYSILKTGRDEYGMRLPLFFRAFDEYKLPLYIYSVVLSQLVLGPTDFAIRLPAFFYAVLSIPVIYLLAKELVVEEENQTLKLVFPVTAAGLLSLSPWHFQFTHVGFEAGSALFFTILGVYLFFRAKRLHSTSYLVSGCLCLSLSLYAYNSARVVTPVLLLILFALYRSDFSVRQWLTAIMLVFGIGLPFLFFALSPAGMVRFEQTSIFYNRAVTQPWMTLVRNLWRAPSPVSMFILGDPAVNPETPYRIGLLHLVEAPFILIGLTSLIVRSRTSKTVWFLLAWLIVGFVPSAVTGGRLSALRAIMSLPVIIFFSAMGFAYVINRIQQVKLRTGAVLVYLVLLIVSTANYLHVYHDQYIADLNTFWQTDTDIELATAKLKEVGDNFGQVYIETKGNSRIAWVWYLKYPPDAFQKAADRDHLGKYIFSTKSIETIPITGNNLYITKQELPELAPFDTIYYPGRQIAFYLYRR